MSVRDVLVRFRADVGNFTSKMDAAKASVGSFNDEVTRASDTKAWGKVSTAALAAGAGITAALGLMVKSAIDWESAWAGVVKTASDTTPAALNKLEADLKSMARELPASAVEIAAVAEAAGQLGVKTADVAGFTRTMIDLGESTNLTAEEAATGIAQISNVMGTGTADVSRFGSALVALGNSSATTEKDILSMTQRLSAVGSIIGMSETDVLGYSAALASVGVEAEAGGTALSQTFTQIAAAVRTGGAELEIIARTAGMTADEFKRAFQQDAAQAMNTFITGLGQVEASGGSAANVLDQLGMTGVRQSNSLLSLANAGDLLSRSLDTASSAWVANNALAEEAGRRYETTESRMRVAMNSLTQAGASIGATLLPALADIADRVADVTGAYAAMPSPIQKTTAQMLLFSGGALLAVGGVMKLIGGFTEARKTVTELREAFPKLDAKLNGVNWGKAAAGAAAVTVALLALNAAGAAHQSALDAMILRSGEASAALTRLAATSGDVNAELSAGFNVSEGSIKSFSDALRYMGESTTGFGQFREGVYGLMGAVVGVEAPLSALQGRFRELDTELANMDTATAAEAFAKIAAEADAQGVSIEQLASLFPQYADTLRQASGAAGETATNQQLLTGQTDSAATSAQAAADAYRMLTESIRAQASAALAASGSMISYYEAVDAATEAAKKNTGGLNANKTAFDLTTEAGQKQARALDGVASAALSSLSAMEKNGAGTDQVRAFTEQARASFIKAAEQMGMNRSAAERMATAYGLVPSDVTTMVAAPGAEASKRSVEQFHAEVRKLPPKQQTDVLSVFNKSGIDAANAALDRINGKTATTYVQTKQLGAPRAVAAGGRVGDAPTIPIAGLAGGGFYGKVKGPGSWTSDSVGPVMLSDEEFVVKASRAIMIERARPGLLDWLNTDGAPLPRGLADGGSLGGFTFAPASAYTPPVVGGTINNVVNLNVDGVRISTGGSLSGALTDLTDRLRLEAVRAGVPDA